METMPYQPGQTTDPRRDLVASLPALGPVAARDWRAGLPVLRGLGLTLRELLVTDAASLVEQLTSEQVSRFISPPPANVTAFERFIAWTHRERAAGRYACFAVVPDGETKAVGIFQVRLVEGREGVAEWGFILGTAYWGTGLFLSGAERVVEFAFEQMGLQRLEARAAVANGRGNGALAKLGAVKEAVLRQSFERHGQRHDQALWSIVRSEWLGSNTPHGGATIH